MSINVMLDLETTGTAPGCCILSIGACSFGIGARETTLHYNKISHADSLGAGFTDDVETLVWWKKQPEEARLEAFSGTTLVDQSLYAFADYLKQFNCDVILWGNGSDFDNTILAAAYTKLGIPIPWKFWNNRCYRTLKNMYSEVRQLPFVGTAHKALDDARNQALHAERLLRYLAASKKGTQDATALKSVS